MDITPSKINTYFYTTIVIFLKNEFLLKIKKRYQYENTLNTLNFINLAHKVVHESIKPLELKKKTPKSLAYIIWAY